MSEAFDTQTMAAAASNVDFPALAALRFQSTFPPALEKAFHAEFDARMMPLRRTISWTGFLLWLSFLLWDYLLLHELPGYAEVAGQMNALRIGIFGIQCFLHWLHFSASSPMQSSKYSDHFVVIGGCVTFGGQCVLTLLAPGPHGQDYFVAGMLVIVAACAGLYCIRVKAAIFMTGVQSLMCFATMTWIYLHPSDTAGHTASALPYPIGYSVYILASMAIGCAVCQLIEIMARRTFATHHMLELRNEAVAKHGADLQTLNAALALSSTEAQGRLEAVIELKECLRRDAEQRSSEKSQFIANAVHDLRQPVQAIVNALVPVTIAIRNDKKSDALELLDLSRRAILSMQEQLSAILDISQLESGRVQPDLKQVDLRRELSQIAAEVQGMAEQFKIEFRLLLPEATVSESPALLTQSDPLFLRRILVNLISNGAKYRRSADDVQAFVQLSIRREARDEFCIAVLDNGLGIPSKLLEQGSIFQPFFQANNHLAQGDKGVGLGLTIVRALTALLPGHRLTVQSEPEQGSCFSLTLPRVPPNEQVSTQEEALPNAGVAPALGPNGLYTLLVEDDELVRMTTLRLLQSLHICCEAFASYEELEAALDQLERVPEVVLSDYRLPNGRTAVDVRLALLAHGLNSALVVFSGETADLSQLEALAGVPTLRKPMSSETLMQALFLSAQQSVGNRHRPPAS